MLTIKQRLGRMIFPRLPITRFLFEQIRVEVNAAATRAINALSPSRRAGLRRLRSSKNLRVNVACGPFPLNGFINLDLFSIADGVIRYDCRRSLPFADESVAGIRVEHFLEHLEVREELPAFLRECRRVLQVGGVLRIIVPDAGRFLRAYSRNDPDRFSDLGFPEPFPAGLATPMDVVSHVFHQDHEHRWGYDLETLVHRLTQAGFVEVKEAAFRQGVLNPALAADDLPVHAPYSLYVEAAK